MPTPPALTDEQRRAAYEKSLELRRQRQNIKQYIAVEPGLRVPGQPKTAVERLRRVWTLEDSTHQGMKVYDLLTALPNVGPKTARAWLKTAGIPEKNTVRACGPRQVERLFDLLNR